jgi:hypothetical protein
MGIKNERKEEEKKQIKNKKKQTEDEKYDGRNQS